MAKKKDSTEISVNGKKISGEGLKKLLGKEIRDFKITSGSIKDMMCNYEMIITAGEVGVGAKHKVTGSGVVDPDLLTAMGALNVHVACLDDSFKIAGVEIEDIDKMRGHELSGNYQVSGFRISGGAGDEKVVLMFSKYISLAGDHMEPTTPKIPLNQSSSYTWHNELSTAIERVREEVALYHEGKYTEKEPVEREDENQLEIFAGNEKTNAEEL